MIFHRTQLTNLFYKAEIAEKESEAEHEDSLNHRRFAEAIKMRKIFRGYNSSQFKAAILLAVIVASFVTIRVECTYPWLNTATL